MYKCLGSGYETKCLRLKTLNPALGPRTLHTSYFHLQERAKDWQARLGRTLGLVCVEISGDSDDTADLDAADIVCITPEKFDSLTRKHRDHGGMRFFGEARPSCVDPSRSSTLSTPHDQHMQHAPEHSLPVTASWLGCHKAFLLLN